MRQEQRSYKCIHMTLIIVSCVCCGSKNSKNVLFCLFVIDIIWKKHLDLTISGKQSNNYIWTMLRSPLPVIGHILTVGVIGLVGNW